MGYNEDESQLVAMLIKIMPTNLSIKMKEEGAKILAESMKKEVERQSELTGLKKELILEATLQFFEQQLQRQRVLH
ncbi:MULTISPECIES: hypothetical protein [Serratia]|uniref:hypothetical protein n=1 Tax=Serratia TaxID=613 RepID=UPI00217C8409|nr:hypothetical protein [Serratia marcescens]CAI1726410.1 Uncharacterised protein [Serratia marcescens]